MAKYKVQVVRGHSNKAFLRLVAANGETVMHGEIRESLPGARETAKNVAEGEIEVDDQTLTEQVRPGGGCSHRGE